MEPQHEARIIEANNNSLHVFLVSFPGQGHVNPLLRLGKLLAFKAGFLVTFSTIQSTGMRMKKATSSVSGDPTPVGNSGGMIRFEFFEDGWSEDDEDKRQDLDKYLPQLEAAGKKSLTGILQRHAREGRPVTCLINNPFIPWVSDLAESLNIPSAVLWVQSCACFSSYYHYQHSSVPFPTEEKPDIDIQLPKMPVFKYDEIPSFLHPLTPYSSLQRAILGQFKNLSKPFCVLMETFMELEDDLINYMSEICLIRPIGPLFKNPVLETSSYISGDFVKTDDCLEWLDSKDPSSVVYVSFGSVVVLNQEQVDELAYGILSSGVSFLWVIRASLPVKFLEDAVGKRGMVVQWSPQGQVLSHPAVACFVTHCGWNSTLEALSCGVPVMAFPQWGDQVTNAKYLVEEWKVGIRMSRGVAENKVVGREEVERYLREATSGVKAAEMKENVLRWKKAAKAAVAEGGSSDRNIQEFVEVVKRLVNK